MGSSMFYTWREAPAACGRAVSRHDHFPRILAVRLHASCQYRALRCLSLYHLLGHTYLSLLYLVLLLESLGKPASRTRPRTGITSWTELDSILLLGLQDWLGYGYCGLAYAREDISSFLGFPDNLVTMAVCVHKYIVRTDLWVI